MKNALELKNVSKIYEDFQIKDMTFSLPTGCILGLIGKNGAGKSTTIKMILNTVHKDGGEIKVLGKNNAHGFAAIRERIGVVLDEAGFPEYVTVDRINKIMKNIYKNWEEKTFYCLVEKFSIPRGKKKFQDYSRGMKMKLAIAVALSHQAKLLIMDEPTSGLDPVVRDEILDIFYDFTRQEDHSILISSHIVGDLEKLCDYVAYLKEGKLEIFEEKDQLIDQYGILKASKEELEALVPEAVIGIRENEYGVEALVNREKIPVDYETEQATLEQLIIFWAKKERK